VNNKLDDQLPELMTRATDGLEPESVDLVERSLAQGVRLRRRRSAVAGVAAGGAVLVTMGLVVAGVQHFDQRGEAAPAGPLVVGPVTTPTPKPPAPSASASNPTQVPPTANPKDPTLLTLKSLVKGPGRTFSAPETWGGTEDGFFAAALVVDDGKGGSRVQVLLERLQKPPSCVGEPGCR
jgi:hypothetical protein